MYLNWSQNGQSKRDQLKLKKEKENRQNFSATAASGAHSTSVINPGEALVKGENLL